jgi:hypothetical protein
MIVFAAAVLISDFQGAGGRFRSKLKYPNQNFDP